MYVPKEFAAGDPAIALAFMRAHPFATLITCQGGQGGEMMASHLPLLLSVPSVPSAPSGERGHLRGHLARQNPQFSHLSAGAPVLAIFHGPHGYVSPSLYENHPSVPTWNYGAVHVYGQAQLLSDAELDALLDDSVAAFEGGRKNPWTLALPSDVRSAKRAQIAGFSIAITRVEGKLKLSQNRTPEEQRRVVADLESGDAASRELATLMRQVLGL